MGTRILKINSEIAELRCVLEVKVGTCQRHRDTSLLVTKVICGQKLYIYNNIYRRDDIAGTLVSVIYRIHLWSPLELCGHLV